MIWEGDLLERPGDFVGAMCRLQSEAQAAEFLAAARDAHGVGIDANLGYLTGYMSADEGARVRALLGVEHPVMGDLAGTLSPGELLQLGMSFQKYAVAGDDFGAATRKARDDIRARRQWGSA